jgi:GT2 family glycosyltransferase
VRLSDAEWLIFLDADDELDSHYIEEMLKGQGDIRQPSTLGVVNGKEDDYPVLIPPHPGGFLVGNHLVIGCMVRRKLFLDVGGFRNLPILEDWDLWIRCILYDGKVGTVPKAIYRVHVNPNSRNQQDGHGKTYTEIQGLYINEWRAKGFK